MDLFQKLKLFLEVNSVSEIIIMNLKKFFAIDYEISLEELAMKYEKEIFNELGETLSYFQEHIADIQENFEKYETIYNEKLHDGKSQEVFVNLLCGKVYMDIAYIAKAYSSEDIYFDDNIWSSLNNEVYVDCGGYTGDTALAFISHCPNYKKVFVFEPFSDAAKICEKNLEYFINDKSAIVFRKAVFNQKTEVLFAPNQGIGDSQINKKGDFYIPTALIDDAITDTISFIKMDIEGTEKEALLGAAKHIKNEMPKLAICVYHLKDDFWKIPNLILEINPDYKFMLRQHRPDVYSETVLYAIPKKRSIFLNESDHSELNKLSYVISKMKLISQNDFENLITNLKDKIWYLYQLRMKTIAENQIDSLQNENRKLEELCEERTHWSEELLKGKSYLEEQLKNYQNTVSNLEMIIGKEKAWSSSLLQTKIYLEDQIQNYQKDFKAISIALENQKKWSEELLSSKEYLEEQLLNHQRNSLTLETDLENQKKWSEELLSSKEYLEEQLLNYQRDTKTITIALEDQKKWSEQLLSSKEYLDTQVNNYEKYSSELLTSLEEHKNWCEQLQKGKDYLDSCLKQKNNENIKLNQINFESELRISELNNTISKLNYKLNKVTGDSIIKAIIKLKKLEI